MVTKETRSLICMWDCQRPFYNPGETLKREIKWEGSR